MDDSLQELEDELKSLSLRAPSAELTHRIAADLAGAPARTDAARPRYTTSTNLSSWKWVGWRTAGLAAAAAALAMIAVINFPTAPAQPSVIAASVSPDAYQPVTATNVLYDMKDEGLVRTEDDTAARRMRYRYLDTYTWKNPKTNASIKWSVPRDEIRLVAATLN
ncbi:MAG: hypothetical protein JWQ62_238 [Lacunisphaera sp.]|nr:hypothetical protein [Lacunisphaera sp.]